MNKPTLTTEQKEGISRRVVEAFKASGFSSRNKYARVIGLTSSDFSNLEHMSWKKNEKLLSVEKWLRIARAVGYQFNAATAWNTAQTAVFSFITTQLDTCQNEAIASILCDEPGIGKTHAAKDYAARTRNAFYVNGGLFPNRWRFIRALAQSMGLDNTGSAEEVLQNTTFYLKSLQKPLIIIDEAGDMQNATYLILKRLYNELEGDCGFFMMGAPDLRKRIDSSIRLRRNGFEEVYSRFGGRFTKLLPEAGTPDGAQKRAEFIRKEKLAVCTANGIGPGELLNQILNDGDLRSAAIRIRKHRAANAPTQAAA